MIKKLNQLGKLFKIIKKCHNNQQKVDKLKPLYLN